MKREFPRRVTRIGLPFHGLVQDGRLVLPDSSLKAYDQPNGGSAWPVRNAARIDSRERTEDEEAFDTSRGHRWQDYALLSGSDKIIGAVELGSSSWLWVDAVGTVWQLSVETTIAAPDIDIAVKVVGRFGMLGIDPDPELDATIGSATYTVSLPSWWSDLYDGDDEAIANNAFWSAKHLDHATDGSPAVLNIQSTDNGDYFGLLAWVEIAVSGTGSTDTETFGNGISASLTVHGVGEVFTSVEVSTDLRCRSLPLWWIESYAGASYISSWHDVITEEWPADPSCEESSDGETGMYTMTTNYVGDAAPDWSPIICRSIERVLHVYAGGGAVSWSEATELGHGITISEEAPSVTTQQVVWRYHGEGHCFWEFVIGTDETTQGCAPKVVTYTVEMTATLDVCGNVFNMTGRRDFESSQSLFGDCENYTDDTLTWVDETGAVQTDSGAGLIQGSLRIGNVSYSHLTNNCWVVICSHTEKVSEALYQAVYRRYVATNAGTQELTATTIDEQPPASFRATYDPVRDLIAWSDDDEVCFV